MEHFGIDTVTYYRYLEDRSDCLGTTTKLLTVTISGDLRNQKR